MIGEEIETGKPTHWKSKVVEMAPVATSLLLISATYSLAGVVLGDRTWVTVGVCAGAALVSLPALLLVAAVARIRAPDLGLLKSWFLLIPVVGWLAGTLLLRWIRTAML